MNRRSTFITVIVAGIMALLAIVGGILGNLVEVPTVIRSYAWPLIAVIIILTAGFAWFELRRQEETPPSIQMLDIQNRQRLLKRVQAFWINGVLDKSLHNAVFIELGLSEQLDATTNPWNLVLQYRNQPERPLPPGTNIVSVYDNFGGELLILGNPGSGKTTLLLQLARELLIRADRNDIPFMPIVFNLSSWAVKRQPINEWLVEELNTKYQVPRPLSISLVNNDLVLPLLDGLDEVSSLYQNMCIETINTYRRQHGLVPMVVCSRSVDYFAQTARLQLNSAVVIQPLTAIQIDEYLSSTGGQLEVVRVALHNDAILRELATTPLMLNILTVAYYGKPLEYLQRGSFSTVRRQVFANYSQHMILHHRQVTARYTAEEIQRWLTWLAQNMKLHSQTEFYIERIQPGWLPDPRLRRRYRTIVNGLIGTLIGGLMGVLAGGLVGGLIVAPIVGKTGRQLDELVGVLLVGVPVGLVIGMLGGLIIGLLARKNIEIQPTEVLVWSWQNTRQHLAQSLLIGLIGGLSFWRLSNLLAYFTNSSTHYLLSWFIYELAGSLIGGAFSGLIFIITHKITLDQLNILRNQKLRSFIRSGILLGFIVGLIEAVLDGKIGGTIEKLLAQPGIRGFITPSSKLGIGLVSGLISGLIFGLVNGFSGGKLDNHRIVLPNEGIRRSLRNGVRVGLLIWVLFWIIFVLASILTLKFFYGIIFGISLGLIFGLLNGGIACLQHAFLRLFFWSAGAMPLNYARFLDYAADRLLLRKVGGGYIFIHRLLLEYFATSDDVL